MNILIVEDESRSASRLARMISAIRPEWRIYEPLPSLKRAVAWFAEHTMPDIVFLDIELSDGTAFDLLDEVDICAPIIFCTAFSQYAIEAFKANSIDYVLKPVTPDMLATALAKYDQLKALQVPPRAWRHLRGVKGEPVYRDRFFVKNRNRLDVVPVKTVIALEAWLKASRLITSSGQAFLLDETLKAAGEFLNPKEFFQVSRETILRISSIGRLDRQGGVHVAYLEQGGAGYKVSRARVKPLRQLMT